MLRDLRNTKRLIGIALVLAREDALFIFEELQLSSWIVAFGKLFARRSPRRKGTRLAAALKRLGPAFIKLGQALSTRSDLIGEAMADDLAMLRDKLPPFPASIARAIISEELHASVESLFKEFSDTPIAAASIAQVHKAITKEGRTVAIKILRPHIEKAFARDLDLFMWVAEFIEKRAANAQRIKPIAVVRTLQESVFFELDLRFEGAAAKELADNAKRNATGMHVPEIDWSRTSRRVLTTEWIDGIPINDIEAIKHHGFNPDTLLAKAAKSLFAQVFVDGFFHADLHPGNLFVDTNGDIAVVDFGIMGRLDWNSRIYMAEILRGFLTQDYRHVAEMHFKAGYVPAGKSIEAFTQACMAVAQPIVGRPLNEISVAKLLGQMFRIAAEFEMETQPQLLLLQKTMMVTEGVGRMLNPNLNMWELARPMIESWASENFGAQAKLKEAGKKGADMLRRFPEMLDYVEHTLKILGTGQGIKLHPKSIEALHQGQRHVNKTWPALGWVCFAAALMYMILS